jgi:hypothetical protein
MSFYLKEIVQITKPNLTVVSTKAQRLWSKKKTTTTKNSEEIGAYQNLVCFSQYQNYIISNVMLIREQYFVCEFVRKYKLFMCSWHLNVSIKPDKGNTQNSQKDRLAEIF